MPIIYRIENNKGIGPYNPDSSVRMSTLFGDDIHADWQHPAIWEDYTKIVHAELQQYYCAFHDKSLIMKWFEPIHIEKLLENGYIIREIEVEEYLKGNSGKQCFFKKEHIINQKTINL